jgi:ABC-type dipeptide/oligopeptide/nickel transport system permease subunit
MKLSHLLLLILLLGFGIVFLFPFAAPYSPTKIESAALQPPSLQYPFGTDSLGRDVLSRFLWGGQRTLLVTMLSVSFAIAAGIGLGLVAGYSSRWVDTFVVSILNATLALPGLFLALLMISLLGQGTIAVGLAIGVAQIAPVGQITRTAVRAVRSEPYVTASVAIGATWRHTLLHAVFLNALPTIIAYGSVTFAYCLLNVAAFGYLGLMGQPEIPEWGNMLAEGREVYREAIWVSIPPGIAITFLVMLANIVANRLSQSNPSG